ncbi:hypothetical protein HK100_002217, partial [Physocladia obscura]
MSQSLGQQSMSQSNLTQSSLTESRNETVRHAEQRKQTLLNQIVSFFPVFSWGSRYSVKSSLVQDLLAGLTLSTLVIPQAMAYAGPYAVVSVMVSQIATSATLWMIEETPFLVTGMSDLNSTAENLGATIENFTGLLELMENGIPTSLQPEYSDVVMFLTFIVGAIQLFASVLDLGNHLTKLIPDSLIAGFMSSSGICVLVSQLKTLFGLNIPQYDGAFSLMFTIYAVVSNMLKINWCAFGLAVGGYLTMILIQFLEKLLNKAVVSRWNLARSSDIETSIQEQVICSTTGSKKTQSAVTDVILTVLVAALVTSKFNLAEDYNVKIIGPIPDGLPTPKAPWNIVTTIPRCLIIPMLLQLIPGAVSLALVCFVTTHAISKTFAEKASRINSAEQNNQQVVQEILSAADVLDVSASQDLLALSFATIVGSAMSSYTPCGSLSRSALLANQTNVRTPIGSLVAVIAVIVVLVSLGAWFENVPLASLAAIVVAALAGVLKKCNEGIVMVTDAQNRGQQVLEAIRIVEADRQLGEASAIVENYQFAGRNDVGSSNLVTAIAELENVSPIKNVTAVDINAPDEINDEITDDCQIDSPSLLTEINFDRDLYILRLRHILVYKDAVVWWGTFLSVLILDAGT